MRATADRVLRQLEDAWNSADGEAFGAPFADDAEFVTVRGEHYTGRISIAKGHQAIFDSIYKDSVNRFETVVAKQLGDSILYVLGRTSALSSRAAAATGRSRRSTTR